MVLLMAVGSWVSVHGLGNLMVASSVFAFGLVAFGFLGMGPVTIAVDSYGPVTDNAQSVFELSLIEQLPGIKRSEEHTSELQSRLHLVCRLLLEKKKKNVHQAIDCS